MPKKRPEQRFYLGKTTVLESANQGPLVGRPFRVTRREMALFGHADWEGRLVKAGGRLTKGRPQQGLKDMTSMSGLRQELPQDLSNTPGAASARRISIA